MKVLTVIGNVFETDYEKMETSDTNVAYGIMTELHGNTNIEKVSSIIFTDKDANHIILTNTVIQSSIFMFEFFKKTNNEYIKLENSQIQKFI